jgi:hypothetical protein
MKTRLRQLLLAVLLSLLLFNWGCNKNTSTGPNDNASISGSGSDYFPLTGNQIIIGKATGQSVTYDSLGNVVESQSVSQQEEKGYIGAAVLVGGMQSYPLYSYNKDGTTTIATKTFIAQNNQAIVGFSGSSSIAQLVTALPAEINIGTTWIANPSDSPNKQVTLRITDSKSSYTNSTGIVYSNVIKVNGVLSDSTSNVSSGSGWSYYSLNKTKANVDIYYAKGVGLIDVQINQYEITQKYWEYYSYSGYNYYWSSYYRTATSGTIGRTN